MTSLTLIANSNIQFHRIYTKIDPNEKVIKRIGFTEDKDDMEGTVVLEYAYYVPSIEQYVPKKSLKELGYLDEKDRVKDDEINPNRIQGLDEETEYYSVSNIAKCLSGKLENQWLPIPYFKKNQKGQFIFGPLTWARMILKPLSKQEQEQHEEEVTHVIVLAFDTEVVEGQHEAYFAPRYDDTLENDNKFALCTDEDRNLNFCDEKYFCGWVEEYIRSIMPEKRMDDPFHLRHLAEYLYLIRYMAALDIFPEVEFYTDRKDPIDVDLVLDIGNSDTCGILFESPAENRYFDFTAVKKLQLRDLSQPEYDYNEAFSMRLAFKEAKFGDVFIPDHKNFRWPSLLRVGEEAARLVGENHLGDKGVETVSTHSSPKRYLWDLAKTENPWEYITEEDSDRIESIYYEGITEQFKEDGSYATDGAPGTLPRYSRQSLMTFVYIEIILQAFTQVNSHQFRDSHGNLEKRRRIRRITITCPTSITQKEQLALHELAVTAVKTLDKYFKGSFLHMDDDNEDEQLIDIVPRPKDLGKKLNMLETRRDWIYDEATCCQLVFLYGELSRRYLNNCKPFFDLYGKKRTDISNPETNSLTIGTVDIGGGTTDLMISAYQYDPSQSAAVIKANPLYWESFNLAGDDLLKNVIQEIIIENTEFDSGESDENGSYGNGVIEKHAKRLGCPQVSEMLNNFFGHDSTRQDYRQRIYRKNFVIQVAVPIAQYYLNHAREGAEDTEVGFEDLFPKVMPNEELLKYVNDHFSQYCDQPFVFQDIRWKLSKDRVFRLVEGTFDRLLTQTSMLMSAYGCDFVLLAGKPTTLSVIKEMYIKYYPVSPDRIITLNDYRVGHWYPFATDNGFFDDPKSIVATGALIALTAGQTNKLEGFRLDTELLKTQLISTADYIGPFNKNTNDIEQIFLSPEKHTNSIVFNGSPMTLGFKQIANRECDGRPMYKIQLNRKWLLERARNNGFEGTDETMAVEKEQIKVMNRVPLTVTLERIFDESKEELRIVEIEDKDENPVAKGVLELLPCTLPDEKGYWLDTGEFTLNIGNTALAE